MNCASYICLEFSFKIIKAQSQKSSSFVIKMNEYYESSEEHDTS